MKRKCETCDHCIYIGEGDFICEKNIPRIVISYHNIPTKDYLYCIRNKRNNCKNK